MFVWYLVYSLREARDSILMYPVKWIKNVAFLYSIWKPFLSCKQCLQYKLYRLLNIYCIWEGFLHGLSEFIHLMKCVNIYEAYFMVNFTCFFS